MSSSESVLIKNVYYMLSYAFRALRNDEFESISVEEFDNIHNLFAAILAKGLGRQIKQGLYREYVNSIEELQTVRGTIDFPETIRSRMRSRKTVTCGFDLLTEDNLFNQILRSTALLLYKHPNVDKKHKRTLRQELIMLNEISVVDLCKVDWSAIRRSRVNRSYQLLLGICQLVVSGMLMGSEFGSQKLATFVDDQEMSKLYEKFLLEYFRFHFPEIKVAARQVPWALDDDNSYLLPTMQTDVTLEKDGKILIIDAKFYGKNLSKNFNTYSAISGNLYQLFAYVKNKASQVDNPQNVSGMLLYAATTDQLQPNATYSMSGNQIMLRSLDLNQPFDAISRTLNQITDRL